jgi:hypothetical protein
MKAYLPPPYEPVMVLPGRHPSSNQLSPLPIWAVAYNTPKLLSRNDFIKEERVRLFFEGKEYASVLANL